MKGKSDQKRWRWATELETLGQLQGGDLPLATIKSLYDSQDHFFREMNAMLHTGQLRLIENGAAVGNTGGRTCSETLTVNAQTCGWRLRRRGLGGFEQIGDRHEPGFKHGHTTAAR